MQIAILVLLGLTVASGSYSMGKDYAAPSYATPSYAAPSYAAPSYEDNYDDVVSFTFLQISVGGRANFTSQIWRQTDWFIIYFSVW